MDGGDYASIIAGIIAALSAWAVSRSAGKANKLAKELETQAQVESERVKAEGVKETTRSQAETEAYERARAFDIATIERQTAEILQVRADNVHLNADVKRVNRENQELFAEREALRNEIRTMHEERAKERRAEYDARIAEREECRRVRSHLVEAIAEGRMDLEQAIDVDTHEQPPGVSTGRRPVELDTHDRPQRAEIEAHYSEDSIDYAEPGENNPGID
jgi:predicted RNase H-like nuclease (RuvC/YqgF family)